MRTLNLSVLIAMAILFSRAVWAGAFVTDLRARGYALIPAPQQVELKAGDIAVLKIRQLTVCL